MKKKHAIVAAACAVAAAVVPGVALAGQGTAANSFHECRTDKAFPNGQYEVNNNNFVGKQECLSGRRGVPAFRVEESGATSTGPGSDAFPNVFVGCSWGRCSPHSWLPGKLAALGDPKTTFAGEEKASGVWGAGYDMFFDPKPVHDGQAPVESMIWLNSRNAYDPAGHWPLVTIDGTQWWAMTWETSGASGKHWRYVQFRRKTPVTSVRNLALGPFIAYLERQGWVSPDWYLLNIEAGFEIWSGGKGLAVRNFSAAPGTREPAR